MDNGGQRNGRAKRATPSAVVITGASVGVGRATARGRLNARARHRSAQFRASRNRRWLPLARGTVLAAAGVITERD
jgi:NAD(P)-dependent dehydrogenase (short-subunit alcohol dehydrogenase family)